MTRVDTLDAPCTGFERSAQAHRTPGAGDDAVLSESPP